MGCTNCREKTVGVCKVCEVVDGNTQVKEVKKCVICNAYLCIECNTDYQKRWSAFLKVKILA